MEKQKNSALLATLAKAFALGYIAQVSADDLSGLDDWHECEVEGVTYDLNIAGADYTTYAKDGQVYVDVYATSVKDGKKITNTESGSIMGFVLDHAAQRSTELDIAQAEPQDEIAVAVEFLSENALNYAVAKAVELNFRVSPEGRVIAQEPSSVFGVCDGDIFDVCSFRALTLQVLQCYEISVVRRKQGKVWEAHSSLLDASKAPATGQTPSLAAMRCLVLAKLGDSVSIPAVMVNEDMRMAMNDPHANLVKRVSRFLGGRELDWAASLVVNYLTYDNFKLEPYSSESSLSVFLMKLAKISIAAKGDGWEARHPKLENSVVAESIELAVARCFVLQGLGDICEIPRGLDARDGSPVN